MANWKTPEDLKYARTDEWLKLDGDNATLGISDYAQDTLNDIVFVELPKVGATVTVGQPFGVVESVKAASDLNAPVSGVVTEVNTALESSPEQINSDPYGSWIVKLQVTDRTGLDGLMDATAYAEYCAGR
jgi:glycine cleavage system H protein